MLNIQLTCKVGTGLEMLGRAARRWISTSFAEGPFVEAPRPWLFVGLGNPGQKFQGTRHNVGFEMIDAFAESEGISMDTVHCKALFGKGLVENTPVFLAKPQTYMNLSGESVLLKFDLKRGVIGRSPDCLLFVQNNKDIEELGSGIKKIAWSGPLAAYYKLPLSRVLLAFDDMDLPCGVLRLQPKGGHAGHNGLKNVIYHFRGNSEFARLRIGIGKPPGQMDPKAFLLQKFNATARERMDAALKEGVEVLRHLISKGLAESSRRFNNEQKYKHCNL